jgi:putative SOS response-associated peptidase YedK
VRRKDQAPFAFAGLWERWPQPGGAVLRSCTIITCPPNELVAPVHDRMPVILAPGDLERWLDPEAGGRELLGPCPAEWLEALPVSPRVNSPHNDDPECIEPIAVQASLL